MEQNVSKSPQACPRECFRIPTSVVEDKQRGDFPEVWVLGKCPATQEKTPESQEEKMQRATAHIILHQARGDNTGKVLPFGDTGRDRKSM